MARGSDKRLAAEQAIADFEQEITRQEDIVYGVALFFECLNLLHADCHATVDAYQRLFLEVIQKGQERLQQATELLESARKRTGKLSAIESFSFSPCEGHPAPAEMTRRAETLTRTYCRIFPGRKRSLELSHNETLQLLDEASIAFENTAIAAA